MILSFISINIQNKFIDALISELQVSDLRVNANQIFTKINKNNFLAYQATHVDVSIIISEITHILAKHIQ